MSGDFLPGLVVPKNPPGYKAACDEYSARFAHPNWSGYYTPRIKARANGNCERCKRPSDALEIHHLVYDRLGRERDEDLQALCPPCHKKADAERRAAMERRAAVLYEDAQRQGWCDTVYGDEDHPEDALERFEEWRDRKESKELEGEE